MFVKQIDMQTALKLAASGREIKLLLPSAAGSEWTDFAPDTLQSVLEGCIFFRDEPAAASEEFEEAVQEMASAPQKPVNGSAEEPSAGTEQPPAECVGTGAKRKKIDAGKLYALRDAGWSGTKIADEMKISEGTVSKYLKMRGDK